MKYQDILTKPENFVDYFVTKCSKDWVEFIANIGPLSTKILSSRHNYSVKFATQIAPIKELEP
jgi:hypothetical protein